MIQKDKEMKTLGASETGEQSFTFPHTPHPIVVKAKSIDEATQKFEDIISNIKEK